MDFSSLLVGLDASVEAHLCDDALYFPNGLEGPALPVRIMIDKPRSAEGFGGGAFTRDRPVLTVSREAVPELKQGDLFKIGGRNWALAEAPTAEDDGRWWSAEVHPG